jgi:tetratricopeptide (TPR) repeat protein
MRKPLLRIVALLLFAAGPVLAGWEEGVAAFRNKDYKTAATEFQAVVDQSPEASSGHYMLGLALRGLDRKEEALNHLRKAYDLNPNDVSIKIELGRCYTDVRRYADAAKLLGTVPDSEIVALDERRKGAFYKMRAGALDRAGSEEAAYADYKRLAGLYPQDAQIQLKYGVLASNRDQMDEARNALDRAHRADPKDQDVKRSYITVLKKEGRIERDKNKKKQKYLQAANLAKELVAQEGTYENWLLRCEVELGAQKYSEAVTSCQSASAKKTNGWLARFYLGQAYSSNAQFAEAEKPLNEAKQLAGSANDRNQVLKQLGFVYEKQKKFSQSIEVYTQAGDSAAVARVKENETTASDNARIEAENARIEQMRKEAEELEKQLKELEGGGGG